jgi:hypothetical protein
MSVVGVYHDLLLKGVTIQYTMSSLDKELAPTATPATTTAASHLAHPLLSSHVHPLPCPLKGTLACIKGSRMNE